MKKVALLCVLCLFLTIIPGGVSAEERITVSVTDVSNDIVTVSCSAPVDTVVSVIVLNPGMSVSDIGTTVGAVQYMGAVFSEGGKSVHNIKFDTGEKPNKNEGEFTILISINGELIYSDTDFVFYSNETKTEYVNILKTGTKDELLAEENGKKILQNIFTTYSLAGHELYESSDIEKMAGIIINQTSRSEITLPADVSGFLQKVLVLNAFASGNKAVLNDEGLKYTEIWAKDGEEVSPLYTDYFLNDLSADGKKAVIDALFGAKYINAQFSKTFEVFEEAMLYNLIMNNALMGSGHIEDYVLTKLRTEYEDAGFDTDALEKITGKNRIGRLDKVLDCGAKTLSALKDKFNEIMKKTTSQNAGGSSSGGGGGGAGGGSVPSKGDTPGYVDNENEKPQTTPEPIVPPQINCPFTDMAGADWATKAVDYLYKAGIINGRSESTFAPNETVTRAELVKMIVEALKVEKGENNAVFSDVNDSDWFADYIKKAASAGIVNGSDGIFRPNDGTTREDAALIIFRALGLEKDGEADFVDSESIAPYAKDAIGAMVKGGYINGMGDGTFAPKSTLTRAQAAQLIYNALIKGGNAA